MLLFISFSISCDDGLILFKKAYLPKISPIIWCIGKLKDKYGITSLSLFGSTARGEQKEGSDIDLFVDTETANPFLLMDAKEFLEKETGTPVDIIRNHQNLNPRLRKRILKDGIFIF